MFLEEVSAFSEQMNLFSSSPKFLARFYTCLNSFPVFRKGHADFPTPFPPNRAQCGRTPKPADCRRSAGQQAQVLHPRRLEVVACSFRQTVKSCIQNLNTKDTRLETSPEKRELAMLCSLFMGSVEEQRMVLAPVRSTQQLARLNVPRRRALHVVAV